MPKNSPSHPVSSKRFLSTRKPIGCFACHHLRFRSISNRYPLRVSEAYGGDLIRAMADSDRTVAATVATWERRHGKPVLDWRRIGRREEKGGA